MKPAPALVFALMASRAIALGGDAPINSASELRDWCKDASEAALIGRGVTPFNWTASYSDQGNVLMVKGKWRVGASNVSVECSVARGAQARFASVTVGEPAAAEPAE